MAGPEIFNRPEASEPPSSGDYASADVRQRAIVIPKALVPEFILDNGVFIEGFGFHLRSRISVRNGVPGPSDATITMTFATSTESAYGNTATRANGVPEYRINYNYIEKPLASHDEYKMKWNNDLYQAVPEDEIGRHDVPDFWGTATDESGTMPFDPTDSENMGRSCRWAQVKPADFELSGVKYFWVMVKEREKPGKEVYLYKQPVVVMKIPFAKLDDAEDATVNTDILVAPARVPNGLNSGARYWMFCPDDVTQEGEWWVANARYLYADGGWDVALYNNNVYPPE